MYCYYNTKAARDSVHWHTVLTLIFVIFRGLPQAKQMRSIVMMLLSRQLAGVDQVTPAK
jgi:hypothetical protein